jgi:hypothetical protein
MARRRNQRDTTKFQDVFDWVIVDQCQLTGDRTAHFEFRALNTATGVSALLGVGSHHNGDGTVLTKKMIQDTVEQLKSGIDPIVEGLANEMGKKMAGTLNDLLKQYNVDDATLAKKIAEETWDGLLDY